QLDNSMMHVTDTAEEKHDETGERDVIVHCDVKPDNLLIAPNRPGIVSDLGFSKLLPKLADKTSTDITFTRAFAHPELQKAIIDAREPAATVAHIDRTKLRPYFDLFAFGRSIQFGLNKIRQKEQEAKAFSNHKRSTFTPYQWRYLEFIAKRMLKGAEPTDAMDPDNRNDQLTNHIIGKLSPSVMTELGYENDEEPLIDFDKLSNFYDLEGEITELNPHIPTYI